MKRFSRITLLVLAAFATTTSLADAAKITWQTSLKKAGQESVRTGKPVLIQFTAEWCGYCHKMLETTYHDPSVVAKVNEFFIPVLLDADENERLVEVLKIDGFPSSVLVSPKQEVLTKLRGFHRSNALLQRLQPFCKKAPQVSLTNTSNAKPATSLPASAEKPVAELAFDGYCLVAMLDDREWREGDKKITIEYEGVKLRFASVMHLAKFKKDPQKYWPLNGGICPVALVREEKITNGTPKTAAVYKGQLVFFKSVEHRREFAKNPAGYVRKVTAIAHSPRFQ